MKQHYNINDYKFLTKVQLNKLTTKRLLSLYRSLHKKDFYTTQSSYCSLIIFENKFENYKQTIKFILDKREHIIKIK